MTGSKSSLYTQYTKQRKPSNDGAKHACHLLTYRAAFLLEEFGLGKVLSLIVLDTADGVCTGTCGTHNTQTDTRGERILHFSINSTEISTHVSIHYHYKCEAIAKTLLSVLAGWRTS